MGLLALATGREPGITPRPVIFIMLDTLRADHLGFYGYERNTSPNLDAFARESLAFTYAFTAAPWTPPSVASMLTGLYPWSHGHSPPVGSEDVKTSAKRLSPELVTLPEVLRQHGYRTAAVSPNPWITPLFGFDQGFESFAYLHKQPARAIVSAGINIAESFLRRRESFFLYLHFFDPHDPYTPPEAYAEMFPAGLARAAHRYNEKALRSMRRYDGEIRYLDDELGRFFSFLKQKGLYDRAMIVVIADHGEQFLEHGRWHHGNALHNEEVHVPFFIRDAHSGRSAGVVEHVVSTVDLLPTILGQLHIPPPENQVDGISVFATESLAKRAGVVSEIRRITDQRGFIGRDKRKAIFAIPLVRSDEDAKRRELWQKPKLIGVFDVQTDYFERRPLKDRSARARLESGMKAAYARAPRVSPNDTIIPASEISDEVLEQLRSLGYLDQR